METESKGFSVPQHRCSTCLELISNERGGSYQDDAGVVWLNYVDFEFEWTTTCYKCSMEISLVNSDNMRYYHDSAVDTRKLGSVGSAINYMHKFSLDPPTSKYWYSEISDKFFAHLNMYHHQKIEF